MERAGPFAGLGQRLAGGLAKRALVTAGDAEKLERLEVVMRKHLSAVL